MLRMIKIKRSQREEEMGRGPRVREFWSRCPRRKVLTASVCGNQSAVSPTKSEQDHVRESQTLCHTFVVAELIRLLVPQ
jgi:hypothetical protein